MAFFNSARLNWPASGDINAWADFIETMCMFSEGDTISIDDFVDFLKDDAIKSTKEILTALNFNENFLAIPAPAIVPPVPVAMPITGAENEHDGEEDEGDEDENEFDGDDPENEEREQMRSRLLVLFNFLQSRKTYFDQYYPFEIVTGTHLRLLPAITRMQRMYIVLLLSSEMHLFSPSDRNRIGHLFEGLCRIPFAYLLPSTAEKRFFGAGAGDILPTDYHGNLHDRLVALAADLNVDTSRIIEDPDELGPAGDAGLDWVGWVPFADTCDHQPVYFGQCACGANWVDKQHETSLSVWRNFLELNQSVQCFHFMPRSFRRNSLDWFRRTQIVHELTLVDRYRLLKIFESVEEAQFDELLGMYTDLLNEAAAFEYEEDD